MNKDKLNLNHIKKLALIIMNTNPKTRSKHET